jgi:hypothetical protein
MEPSAFGACWIKKAGWVPEEARTLTQREEVPSEEETSKNSVEFIPEELRERSS